MFTTFLQWYYQLLRVAITVLITVMLVVVSMQVFSRFTGFIPRYLWTEEASRFCFVWVIMIGSVIAVRERTHFNVDLFPRPKSKCVEGIHGLLTHLAMLVMAFIFVRYGYEFARFGIMQSSEISQVNMLSIYIAFPVAGISWILFLVQHLLHDVSLITSEEQGMDL
jgi:TRAP-type transport system small permease protein